MRILIVDDQVLFREGLVSMLMAQANMTVVGEASTVGEAVAKTQMLKPDLVLIDLMLPDGDGLEAMRAIRSYRPETKIIILTVHDSDDMMVSAMLNGARGYLLKSIPMSKLVTSLRGVARGEAALPRAKTSRILEEFSRMGAISHPIQLGLNSLTSREREVLGQMGTGASDREIGERLLIAENTVRIHVKNIYQKLKLTNRHEAVKFARRYKLMDTV